MFFNKTAEKECTESEVANKDKTDDGTKSTPVKTWQHGILHGVIMLLLRCVHCKNTSMKP